MYWPYYWRAFQELTLNGEGGESFKARAILNQLYSSFLFEFNNEIYHVVFLAKELSNWYKKLAIYRKSHDMTSSIGGTQNQSQNKSKDRKRPPGEVKLPILPKSCGNGQKD